MAMNLSIRPGAALAEPETYSFVEREIINASYGPLVRRSWIPDRAYNKDGIVNVLANYPWRPYHYKYGRWHRVPFFPNLPFVRLRTWAEQYDSILLVDPATRRGLAEVTGIALFGRYTTGGGRAPHSGSLLFAGDPQLAGVVNAVVGRRRHMFIVGSVSLRHAMYAQEISAMARDLTKVMTPEQAPPILLSEPPPDDVQHLGPWVADHPRTPPRPRKR